MSSFHNESLRNALSCAGSTCMYVYRFGSTVATDPSNPLLPWIGRTDVLLLHDRLSPWCWTPYPIVSLGPSLQFQQIRGHIHCYIVVSKGNNNRISCIYTLRASSLGFQSPFVADLWIRKSRKNHCRSIAKFLYYLLVQMCLGFNVNREIVGLSTFPIVEHLEFSRAGLPFHVLLGKEVALKRNHLFINADIPYHWQLKKSGKDSIDFWLYFVNHISSIRSLRNIC